MSLKKNLLYNTLLTVSGYLFPFLTFPYVSRVLGLSNIGICNFVDSIINYFILFSMMGISRLGIREIAKNRGDKTKLSRVFSTLLTINGCTTFLALIVLVFCIIYIDDFSNHKELFYIGGAKLIANFLLIEWFYQGIENFRYITLRSLVIRVIYVVSIFIFIHEPDDYILYFLLTTMMFVVNAFINLWHSKSFINFEIDKKLLVAYFIPFITLGSYQILTSMYTTFNVAFLGFTCGTNQVGVYSTAIKLYTIILSLYTAFTSVMIPRLSSLVESGNQSQFKALCNKSVDILLAFCFPVILVCELYAPHIINLLAGVEYEGAITPMRIILPLLFIVGYEQILVFQVLIPLRKDKAVLINSFIGALVGITLNFVLVPRLEAIGSAVTWICAELAVLCAAQVHVAKYTNLRFPFQKIMKYLTVYSLVFGLLFTIQYICKSSLLSFTLSCIALSLCILLIETKIMKNTVVLDIINTIRLRYKL